MIRTSKYTINTCNGSGSLILVNFDKLNNLREKVGLRKLKKPVTIKHIENKTYKHTPSVTSRRGQASLPYLAKPDSFYAGARPKGSGSLDTPSPVQQVPAGRGEAIEASSSARRIAVPSSQVYTKINIACLDKTFSLSRPLSCLINEPTKIVDNYIYFVPLE